MKKSLLLSAISIAGAAALVAGMTFASFNDTQTSRNPSLVAAGTIQLDQHGVTMPLEVTNLKPGEHADFTIDLRNPGTLDGDLYAKIADVWGYENGCDVASADGPPVEASVDPGLWAGCFNDSRFAAGDLVQYLTFQIAPPGGTFGTLPPASDANGISLGTLPHHGAGIYTLRVTFTDAGLSPDKWTIARQNQAQGDGAWIKLRFALVQSS